MKKSTILGSKSSSPKCVAFAVAQTSNMPPSISRSVTANELPPRSKIRT